jgi:hypothetical protein
MYISENFLNFLEAEFWKNVSGGALVGGAVGAVLSPAVALTKWREEKERIDELIKRVGLGLSQTKNPKERKKYEEKLKELNNEKTQRKMKLMSALRGAAKSIGVGAATGGGLGASLSSNKMNKIISKDDSE